MAKSPEQIEQEDHMSPAAGLTPLLERLQKYLEPLERIGAQKTAWIGSFLLFIGIFLPTKAASVPFLNVTVTASFWDYTKLESFLLILFALVSVGLAYIRDYKWLWATGLAALLLLVMELFDSFTQSYIHPSWGWLVLFPGVALILAGAALKRDPNQVAGNATTVVKGLVHRFSDAR